MASSRTQQPRRASAQTRRRPADTRRRPARSRRGGRRRTGLLALGGFDVPFLALVLAAAFILPEAGMIRNWGYVPKLLANHSYRESNRDALEVLAELAVLVLAMAACSPDRADRATEAPARTAARSQEPEKARATAEPEKAR